MHNEPHRPRGRLRSGYIALVQGVLLASVHGADAGPPPPRQAQLEIEPTTQAFPLTQVRLLDGPFRDAMMRNREYLLSLEPDRFLHMFRVTAGLPSNAEPYGGWERPTVELRGHSLGHYLSAISLLYASTGEAELKRRADYVVAELAKCQAASPTQGFGAGYLAAFPESWIDRVEAGQPVWAPYYTLHKIMAGLLDAYLECGNRTAIEVVSRQADWVKSRMDRLSFEHQQRTLGMEFGGMNEVLANLHAVTGRAEYLELARVFDHQVVFDPLARGEDRLDGLHANTQIPKFIGAARGYELTGDTRYRDVARFAWQRVALHHSYVIGGHSDREHFFPTDQFERHLSPETAETCNTYNMLKLTRHLFGWTPTAELMDFYERALYNHILASQDPREGMFVYLMSLKPGHFKTYSQPHDAFWCCVGTGMENHAKYGDTIFFHDDTSLYVNLFIASELDWPEAGLTVRLETKFPEEETVRLSLACASPVEGSLKLRWPRWADRGFAVRVNGEPQAVTGQPGSYVTLRREWRDGDRVEVRAPMRLLVEHLPGVPDVVAVLYGPLVLAGELGREGLEGVSPYVRQQLDQVRIPTPRVPVWVADAEELPSKTEPVPGHPLVFRTKGVGRPQDVTLRPFHQIHHQRYSVYWDLFTEAGWEAYGAELARAESQAREQARRLLDFVTIGDPNSERRHQFKGESTQTGTHEGRPWRHASDGGWFSYNLAVHPDRATKLQATFWGDDAGSRTFDIVVNGRTIATQTLERSAPGRFFEVVWPLPTEVTGGQDRITVRFQAHPGQTAGGVFGLATLR